MHISTSNGQRDGYECLEYIKDVVAGKELTSEKVYSLCKMLKPRFGKKGYKQWHYDSKRAAKVVNFVERFCCNPQGKPGQLLKLEPFQLFWIEVAFGFVDDSGIRQFNECMVIIGRKNGKALSLDTEIPTPDGFKEMGDIHVGDEVFGVDGKPHKVIAESEIFNKKMYAVTFEDGSCIKASADHLWSVQTKNVRRNKRWRAEHTENRRKYFVDIADNDTITLTTEDMLSDYYRERADGKGVEYKYRVPMNQPIEYPEKDLPIDPYVLGAWLGDGTNSKPEITCGVEDKDAMMENLAPSGYKLTWRKYKDKAGKILIDVTPRGEKRVKRNEFLDALRECDLIGHKYIPRIYMQASIEQRLELLKGLMDTDGYCSKAGQCEFVQQDSTIAYQITELLSSLGIKNTMRRKYVKCNGKEFKVYDISFFTDKAHSCFKLKRKHARLKEELAPRMKFKSIRAIEDIPVEPSKCITIDSADHLYLASRSFTATHNSSLAAALGLYMLTADGEGAPQCYSAATSKEQASLLYGSMVQMVRQSPMLRKRLHKGIIPDRASDGLMYKKNGGYFTPLSSQTRNLDGLNVHFAAIDEMAAITNRDLYDLIKQGTSSRSQPMVIEITTNGFERDNLFDQQYNYAEKILKGEAQDDALLPVIYELDSRQEWTNKKMWKKANPGLGTIKRMEVLEGFYTKAKQDPAFLPTFMTKDMNMPENRASAWLRFEEAVNREKFDYKDMGFRYCIVGYDASDSIDLTAARALMMRPGDEKIYELSHYWLPKAALDAYDNSGYRKERDNVPYRQWVADGLLTIVEGNKIDHTVVFDWMQELREVYDVWPYAMGYDPWHLTDDSWINKAQSFVGRDRLEIVRQGAKSLSIPMKEIRADFAKKRMVDNDHPINQWCRMNVGVVVDRNDNWLPKKGNGSTGRIDGFMAELMAYIALKRHYEDYMNII